MTIDRRVARTRTALYDGLVALILKKNYDDIGIQDILDEANVGRSTFYAHFTSKDDLLERSLERLHAILVRDHQSHAADHAAGAASWRYSRTMFTHVAEYKRIYYALVGSHAGAIVLRAQRDVLARFIRDHIALSPLDGVPRELVIQHITSTFITVMTWWLNRRPTLPPDKVDAMFRRLVGEGIGRD